MLNRPPILVYVGTISAVTGATPDGNCTTIRVSGRVNGQANPRDVIDVTNRAVDNLISCDVQMKAPVKGDCFEFWVLPDGKTKLFLKMPQVLYKDCP